MGHIFQAECWVIPRSAGVHMVYYDYGNWEKAMDNDLERKRGIYWHLLLKIMENGREGR